MLFYLNVIYVINVPIKWIIYFESGESPFPVIYPNSQGTNNEKQIVQFIILKMAQVHS